MIIRITTIPTWLQSKVSSHLPQNWSAERTSPPARVAMAWKMLKLINSLMNRTLPSANRKLAPPG